MYTMQSHSYLVKKTLTVHWKTTWILLALSSLISSNGFASSVYIAADSYDYELSIGGSEFDLAPLGLALGGSLDLTDTFSLFYEAGEWSDQMLTGSLGESKFDSTLLSIGVQARTKQWKFKINYTQIDDELDMSARGPIDPGLTSDTALDSLRFSATREVEIRKWMMSFSLGAQRDMMESLSFFDQGNQSLLEELEATYLTAKLGADYHVDLSVRRAWFIGSTLSWYEEISSDTSVNELNQDRFRRRENFNAGRGAGGTAINRSFGERFGLLGIFAAYQFNDHWSLDFNSSFGFAGDINSNSYAFTLGYAF